MTVQHFTPHRLLSGPTHLLACALLVLGTVLVVGLYLTGMRVLATSTSAAASSAAPASQRLAPPQALPSECAVTGDLVGDGNPADIAAILCGDRR